MEVLHFIRMSHIYRVAPVHVSKMLGSRALSRVALLGAPIRLGRYFGSFYYIIILYTCAYTVYYIIITRRIHKSDTAAIQ